MSSPSPPSSPGASSPPQSTSKTISIPPDSTSKQRIRKYTGKREYETTKRRKRKSLNPQRRDVETGEFATPGAVATRDEGAKRRRISLHEVSALGTPSDTKAVKAFLSSSGEIMGEGNASATRSRIQMIVSEEGDYLVHEEERDEMRSAEVSDAGVSAMPADGFEEDAFEAPPPMNDDAYAPLEMNGAEEEDYISSDLFGSAEQRSREEEDNAPTQQQEYEEVTKEVTTTTIQITVTSSSPEQDRRGAGLEEEGDLTQLQQAEEPVLLDDEATIDNNTELETTHDDTPPPPEGERDLRHWLTAIKSRFHRFPEFYTGALVIFFLSLLLLLLVPATDKSSSATFSNRPIHVGNLNYTVSSFLEEKSQMERFVREYVANLTKEATDSVHTAADKFDTSLLEPLESKVKVWLHDLESSVEQKINKLRESKDRSVANLADDKEFHDSVQQTIAELKKHMEEEMTTQLKHLEDSNVDLFTKLQTRVDSMDGIAHDVDSKLSSFTERIAKIESSSHKEVDDAVDGVLSRIAQLESEHKDSDSRLSTLSSRIARVETEQQRSVSTGLRRDLPQGFAGLDDASLRTLVLSLKNTIMEELESDKVHMPDLALHTRGAEVIDASQGYNWLSLSVMRSSLLRKVFLLKKMKKWRITQDRDPSLVLTPDMTPGNCWSFAGSKGFLVIQLPTYVEPHHFTVDHIAKSIATDHTSAPKDFEVYGMDTRHEGEESYTLLAKGSFDYSRTTQTIAVHDVTPNVWYNRFRLEILSNHGHQEYTCLYRFRIHGNQQNIEPQALDTIIETGGDVEGAI